MSPRWATWRKTVDLDEYDRRWEMMAAEGRSIHGEVDFVERTMPGRTLTILDAGCGTGRLAIEAARRGHVVMGVDLDPDMIERARSKVPTIEWECADLSQLALHRSFDIVVMAGNIPLFCAPGTQGAIIERLARHLAPGGTLVCGFSIENRVDAYTVEDFDRDARRAGFAAVSVFANWDGDPVGSSGQDKPVNAGEYAVVMCDLPTNAP